MYANVQGRLVAKTRKTGFLEQFQPECKLPAATAFPSSTTEVRHVIVGREPVVTDDPADNPLQWLHQCAPQREAMMAEPGQEGKRTSEKERGQVQEFSRFQQQDWTPPQLSWLTIRRDDVLSRV